MALIQHIVVGGSSNDQSKRMIGWGNPTATGYWRRIIDKQVVPLFNAGVKRFIVHNPFGILRNEAMQFDQVVYATRGKTGAHGPLPSLVNEFVPAWASICEAIKDAGGWVMAYFGKASGDPDLRGYDTAPNEIVGPLYFWYYCLWHADHAGMGIGFDASSNVAKGDRSIFHLMEFCRLQLEKKRLPCAVEARPYLGNEELTENYKVISVYDFWNRSNPALHPDAKKLYMPNETMKQEVILLLANAEHRYKDDPLKFVNDCLSRGGSPAMQLIYTLRDKPDLLQRMIEVAASQQPHGL